MSASEAKRVAGNAAFVAGRLDEALVLYSQAIAANPFAPEPLCNRSLTNLKLGHVDAALGDAVTALGIDGQHAKSLFRVGAALEALGDPALARTYYDRAPAGPARSAACVRCDEQACLVRQGPRQSRYGQFVVRDQPGGRRDPAKIIGALTGQCRRFPVAIRASATSTGVGMFATQDISRGSTVFAELAPLVMAPSEVECGRPRCYHCARPLPPAPTLCVGGCDVSYCSPHCEDVAAQTYHVSLLCRKTPKGNAVAMVERAAAALPASHLALPSNVARGVLHVALKLVGWAVMQKRRAAAAGRPEGLAAPVGSALACTPADTDPVALLSRACDLSYDTCAPAPRLFFLSHALAMHEAMSSALGLLAVDPLLVPIGWLCLVETIVTSNAFGICDMGVRGYDHGARAARGTALCVVGSLFNHACKPNLEPPPPSMSAMDTTGNYHAFLAARDIRAGEELCTSYVAGVGPLRSTAERRMRLAVQFNFICTCATCGPAPPAPWPGSWNMAPHPGFDTSEPEP